MATHLLVNNVLLPKLPIKTKDPVSTTSSPQTSISEYFTPQPSIEGSQTSSDFTSTSTDHSSTENTDYEDFTNISMRKHVHFNVQKSKTKISLKLENNEAEFFAYTPSENGDDNNNKPKTTKSNRKRDKIRSAFRKKFPRSNNTNSDTDSTEWNEVFAKSLISMHEDIQEIINGFDQIDQPMTEDSLSNTSDVLITEPHLSFRERQRAKLEIMRMAHMFNPPNLLTYDSKESPYPYTDIIEPHNFNFLRIIKRIPDENLLIQHKPYQHKKFRYRTQRGLLRMKHDFQKLKRDIYGKRSHRLDQDLPSLDVQNYRSRLEKTLIEVRTQIAEYDRINSLTDNHRQSISQIIAKMNTIDPTVQAQIDDYRAKLRPIEYIDKKHRNELISAPFIPRRARSRPNHIKEDEKKDWSTDTNFDPATFVNLNEEAEEFFGNHIPFWDQPVNLRLSVLSPPLQNESNHFVIPSKVEVCDRSVGSFQTKPNNLRNAESEQSEFHNDDVFFDCNSSFSTRKSQLSIPSNDDHPVDF